MIDRPIMDLAIKVAESSKSRKKVGALLLHKNKVITQAVNQDTKSHPLQARLADMVGLKEKIYLHAEISALVKCRSDADTIVVARLGGHGGDEIRNAKPCPICSLALKQAGIEHIYYTTDEGFLYEYK
jgi:tRNA(Arg) A34 adenosine deaminase TadA